MEDHDREEHDKEEAEGELAGNRDGQTFDEALQGLIRLGLVLDLGGDRYAISARLRIAGTRPSGSRRRDEDGDQDRPAEYCS